jgi:DNA polymerase III epsilon subunit family exonuclease
MRNTQLTNPDQPVSDNLHGYDALRDRAFEFLRERNGPIREDELIRFMFGAATRPNLWRSLLSTVLGADHRFRQSADQLWSLASESQSRIDSTISFVAIDVETTGLRPRQHRVIEIGLARYVNGRCTERYSSLINPERRVPDYIRKLTGLTDSDLISAPRFSQVAGEIVAFMGDLPLLGHNVGFDIGFLNAELERAKLPIVANASIDTVPMAMRVLGRRIRPSLDRVASAVGLTPRTYHRALGDAELTAAVALRLLGMAAESGASIESLLQSDRQIRAVPSDRGFTTAKLLDRHLLDPLPRTPGVYLMVDANDRVLYVGKAKSIRDRVASYFSQPLGYTRKMDGLTEAIARIDHEETGSELVALLLESQLIRRHQPPYNRMLSNSETYPYIRIDPANAWPNLRLAKQRRPDGARYFGPYRSRHTAREAIDLLNRRFSLRSCGRGFKTPRSYGNPCLELDLHRCSGPCVGRAVSDEYRAGVNAVIGLLDLERDDVLAIWESELTAASEALNFERAQRLRRELEVLTRLRSEQESLASLVLQEPYLIVQPGSTPNAMQLLLIVKGRWWAQVTTTAANAEVAERRLEAAWRRYVDNGIDEIDHSGVDEANIIARWRKLQQSGEYVIPIDHPSSPGWSALVQQAIGVFSRSSAASAAGRNVLKIETSASVVATDNRASQADAL